MKFYLRLILLVILFSLNSLNVYASSYKIYYFPNINIDGEESLTYFEYNFSGNLSTIEKISFFIKNIFNNSGNLVNYLPENISLSSIYFLGGHLILNFNESAKSYGGTFFELKFITQILVNCFQFEEVKEVSFFIGNSLQDFPEGTTVYKFNRQSLKNFEI